MKMDVRRQKKAVGGYYAAVAYMDAQVGKVLDALERSGQADNTIVIFTSDHGYHLGEHDFWAKVSLHDESAMVPLIIRVPGKKPAVCHSLVELLDLYPTIASLCGLEVPARLQGKDISRDVRRPDAPGPRHGVQRRAVEQGVPAARRQLGLHPVRRGCLGGHRAVRHGQRPQQYTNLAGKPEFAPVVDGFRAKLAARMAEVQDNDLKPN